MGSGLDPCPVAGDPGLALIENEGFSASLKELRSLAGVPFSFAAQTLIENPSSARDLELDLT
jgi:hypothetical protein